MIQPMTPLIEKRRYDKPSESYGYIYTKVTV
jgi:hypothetical protein